MAKHTGRLLLPTDVLPDDLVEEFLRRCKAFDIDVELEKVPPVIDSQAPGLPPPPVSKQTFSGGFIHDASGVTLGRLLALGNKAVDRAGRDRESGLRMKKRIQGSGSGSVNIHCALRLHNDRLWIAIEKEPGRWYRASPRFNEFIAKIRGAQGPYGYRLWKVFFDERSLEVVPLHSYDEAANFLRGWDFMKPGG